MERAKPALRHELLFGDRMVRCFADRPADIWSMVTESAAGSEAAPALLWGDEGCLAYADLLGRAEALAQRLVAEGVRRGDRLATWLSNRAEYPIWFLACWRLGAVLVPMDTRLSMKEAAYLLRHSGAAMLLSEAAMVDKLPASDDLPDLRHVVLAEEMTDWIDGGPRPVLPPHEADEEALAAILYTSGTTGAPKGVMLAHVNIVHSVLHFEGSWGLPRGSRTLLAIPGCNVTGLITEFLTFFRLGGAVVLMPPFRAATFIEEAARHRIDHAFMVPAQYKLCLMNDALAAHDLSSWKLGSFGGAPMPAAFIAELRERLPALSLSNGYGATETASPVALLPAALTPDHPDAVGAPVPCADVIVVDEDGREVPPGTPGELWVAGPMVARGYWNNADATRAAFVGGYWRSGDVVTMGADGLVRLHDRKKDVVNRGGYKIYSAEVEAALAEHPAVAEVAVVGRPDPVLGERAHAFVCLKADMSADADAIAAFARERLSDYKCPEGWTIGIDPLPRNSNGKLLKRELRDTLVERAEA
ncbi:MULTISPECIES: class I adenylate-forming enzyme family protein [unclassified Sphingomonas]|jgi:acyl-CoA synthetase (AMP-forming)/AMP-acid ligase II|uniref:class I adenylate-forming enzyme family protein n=1 Tax=unclassified Sphingomonas TaxID=196159 RepID=UPI000B319F4E|nr:MULTISPECIES: class I adenylate-forming enzyme family protein [unclassified Sphingomonas]